MAFIDATSARSFTPSRTPYRTVRLAVIAVSAGIGHQLASWPGALGGTVLAILAVVALSPLMPDRRARPATPWPHAPRAGCEPRLWSDGDVSG